MESMENWEQRTILPTEASPTLNQGTNPSLWANFDISKLRNAGHKLEYIKPQIEGTLNYTKICTEDIDPEVKCWESAVACYVLGSSPPFSVLIGFVKRIWHDLLIDKIVMLRNGVVLVRFDSVETRDKVLQQGCYQFEKKLFIFKPWHKDFQKEKIEFVPV